MLVCIQILLRGYNRKYYCLKLEITIEPLIIIIFQHQIFTLKTFGPKSHGKRWLIKCRKRKKSYFAYKCLTRCFVVLQLRGRLIKLSFTIYFGALFSTLTSYQKPYNRQLIHQDTWEIMLLRHTQRSNPLLYLLLSLAWLRKEIAWLRSVKKWNKSWKALFNWTWNLTNYFTLHNSRS
jgi:hypothetical protein